MSDHEPYTPRVLVVGGGIAGLATAFFIREFGRERNRSVEIEIWEARDVAGGSTRTERIDGYLCEWGPNGFLDNESATLELVERLGLSNRLVKASDRAAERFIYHHGRRRRVPLSPGQFLRSDLLPLSGKLRVMLEPLIAAKRNGKEESVDGFARRRLGESFAEVVIDPMVSGIFAGNSSTLSLEAVFPKMVEMEREYGGLFRAMIAKRKAAKGQRVKGGPAGPGATLTTFVDGMGELTLKLSETLSKHVRLGHAAQSVSRTTTGFVAESTGSHGSWDGVVLACPSYETATLIKGLSAETAASLQEIPYAPVDVVCCGYRDDAAANLNGFGVLIPRSERKRILGSLWCDSIFPNQAPRGFHLVRTMLGGAHDPRITELTQAQLQEIVEQETADISGINGPPAFRRVIRHKYGIAQYTLGHMQRLATIDKMESACPGLYFTGASYRGVSVNGCAKDAKLVAERFWKGRTT